MPAPTEPLAKASPAIIPAQGLVRVDERTLPRHVGRAVLAGVGAVGVVWCLVGILPLTSGVAAVAALAAAGGLSRRQAFDVLPRARRMIRWRGFFAPSATDDGGEAFSPDSCVVVHRLRIRDRELPWVVLDLVDAEGRDLVRLHGPMSPQRAWTEGPRYARALGVTVRFDVDSSADDALDSEQEQRTELPSFAAHATWRLSSERSASSLRRIAIKAIDGVELGAITSEVPPRRHRGVDEPGAPASLDDVLAEHFILEDAATGKKARLYSTKLLGERATIVVGPMGELLGHVHAQRGLLADVFGWTGPQGRRRLTARIAHGALAARIIDAFGRDVGTLDTSTSMLGEPRPVTVRMQEGRATGDARWGLLALALHVSLASIVEDF
jgi:hypothetical protein